MQIHFIEIIRPLVGLAAGTAIGLGFGLVQNHAQRRNERRQNTGALTTGWAVMPGSMTRVAGFMIVLALVQVFCPLLFVQGSQWWVSGGVAAGYGAALFQQLRRRQLQMSR